MHCSGKCRRNYLFKEATSKGNGIMASHTRMKRDESVNHKEIPGKMKMDYLHGIIDPNQKTLDGIQSLFSRIRSPQMKTDDLLLEAANLISRQFGIDNVAVGLRDPKDGLYKYRAMVGFRNDAIEGHKSIAYRKEQFFEDSQYIGYDISRLSRLYLDEDNVISEEDKKTFNRPGLLTMKRRTTSDSLEGDYIDTKILGANDELLGWIEFSGTRILKLPDAATVRWVEVIASAIGAALICHDALRVEK